MSAQTTGKKKTNNQPVAHAVGRRKRSVARVWLKKGDGNIRVNNRSFEDYFPVGARRATVNKPIELTADTFGYDVYVNVVGGGFSGQADAIQLGITRALVSVNEELKPTMRQNGLLTVDARVKERKKYGQHGARRKHQFVKR